MKKPRNFKQIICCVFFIFFTTTIFAQATYINEKTYDDFVRSRQATSPLKGNTLTEKDIQGSPYLNDEFILGNLITNEGIRYKDIPLRYNIFNDNIEFKVDSNNYLAISNPSLFKEIKIGDATFIYITKPGDPNKTGNFYQLLQDGKAQLLIRYNIIFQEATSPEAYKPAQPPKFKRNANTFYFKTGISEPHEISKKKDLEDIFGAGNKNVFDFIKSEKINIHKEEDLVKLAKFINSVS